MTEKIIVRGIVQGIGFRPFCKNLADQMNLNGTVKNLGGDAEIIINCDEKVSDEFLRRLVSFLPKGGRIDSIEKEPWEAFNDHGFKIIPSGEELKAFPEILPDIATCDSCVDELYSEKNRRFAHPFISCTLCGPRYSIMKSLPYDRENTLMDEFPLCDECKEEYFKTDDRRFFAQTIACNFCGPKLYFKPESENSPLYDAINLIKNGGVIGVKDIGGFHFVCLPSNDNALTKLRNLKNRDKKPFAVMFPDLESLKDYAFYSENEKGALKSDARPIVLLNKKRDFSPLLSADSRFIGAMLPSNPIQHMLTKELGPLVMTSGNISGEPIITDNEAMLSLYDENDNLDGVLYHDRKIITPLDDSIFYELGGEMRIMRRGRGVTPSSLPLKRSCSDTVFAAGGDLKSSFGFFNKNKAVLSQHLGDLEDYASLSAYEKATKHMLALFRVNPSVFVCDLHPGYKSSEVTKVLSQNATAVQHHHAHIASVMAEHSLDEVLGFALDGTGYGTDGTIWGGEALYCKNADFKRVAHLKSVVLCGGDESSKNTSQTLACYLLAAGLEVPQNILSLSDVNILKAAIKNNIGCAVSSSAGRLFDAVSALLSVCFYNDYEGEGAILLENLAASAISDGISPEKLTLPLKDDTLDSLSLIEEIYNKLKLGVSKKALALGFHYALADGFVKVAEKENFKNIALSGGVFANRIFSESLIKALENKGFKVYLNKNVPCGDGGIALGQLYIGTERN